MEEISLSRERAYMDGKGVALGVKSVRGVKGTNQQV